MNTEYIDIYSIHTVCFDCAQLLGFMQTRPLAVWTDRCEVCHQLKACTDLQHDWEPSKKGETK